MRKSSRTARTWCVLVGSAALTLSTITAAAAEDDPQQDTGAQTATPEGEDPPGEEPPAGPEWPPPDSGGQWLPVPLEIAPGFTLEACDSSVTVSPGDVFDVEYHAMHQPNGTIRVEYRGESTVDIVRESDGAMIDELAVGGPGYELFAADGMSITFSWYGPSIIGAFDAVEAEVFANEGLPPLFFYESGNTTERVVFSEDPAAETIESAEFLTDTALGVQDVCDMLDAAGH